MEFYKCFPIDSPFFKNEILDDTSSIDDALLKFSNGLGATITYIIIQSMNPSFDIPGRDAKNDQEKDINVIRWFRDAMSALRNILLPLFKQYMSAPLLISSTILRKTVRLIGIELEQISYGMYLVVPHIHIKKKMLLV